MKIKNLLFSTLFLIALLFNTTIISVSASTTFTDLDGEGEVYDGIDFEALMNGNIYYGSYYHANAGATLGNGYKANSFDSELTPILWTVMGEEDSDGYITSLSTYILDTPGLFTQNTVACCLGCACSYDLPVGASDYNWTLSGYGHSRTQKLNYHLETKFSSAFDAGTGSVAAEKNAVIRTTVYTQLIDYRDDSNAYGRSDAEYWNMWSGYTGIGWPNFITDVLVYAPSGYPKGSSSTFGGYGYWNASGEYNLDYTFGSVANGDLQATFKYGGDNIEYWSRSPIYHNTMSAITFNAPDYSSGYDLNILANEAAGSRPIFKLDPTKIIMMHEVVDTVQYPSQIENDKVSNNFWNYTTSSDRTNYKLTILSDNVALNSLKDSSGTSISSSSSLTMSSSSGITVSSDDYVGQYLAYKIVEEDSSGNRTIVAYGTNKDASDTSILNIANARNELDGSELVEGGTYTLYVWAQTEDSAGKDGASVHSFEGSTAIVIPLEVGEEQPPATALTLTYLTNTTDTVTNMPSPNIESYPINSSVTITSLIPLRDGYTFDGWNTAVDGNGVEYDGTFTITTNLILYAQWIEDNPLTPTVTLEYFSNCGGDPTTSNVPIGVFTYNVGDIVTVHSLTPTRDNYEFTHWEAVSLGRTVGGQTIQPGDTFMIETHIQLYAQWNQEDSPLPPTEPESTPDTVEAPNTGIATSYSFYWISIIIGISLLTSVFLPRKNKEFN